MHLNEEDLILHHYGEGDDRAAHHLAACATCRSELARLGEVLACVDEQPVPEPPPGFEQRMWLRVQPHLPARPQSWTSRLRPFWPARSSWLGFPARWAYAAGVAGLLVMAFVAGRLSSGTGPPTVVESPVVVPSADRLLVIEVVDHLDRSQMMLVELLNADEGNRSALGPEQSRARDLVAANRLYRQSAAQSGDELIGDTLEELERVLLEIANAPGDLAAADLAALRERIASRGLLFRVRVVQSEMRERERQQVTRVIG